MYTNRVRLSAYVTILGIFLGSSPQVLAVVRTWTGLGTTDNWSTTANWAPAGAPANGDDLVFPAGAPRLINTNNLAPRFFNSISFNGAGGGYILRGNAITLTNGITASHTIGANRIEFDIALGASQTFTSTDLDAVLTVNGDIGLGTFTLTVNNTGTNNLGGAISGSGGLTKNGTGRVVLNGAVDNSFAGITRVNAGTLQLTKFALVSIVPLIIEPRLAIRGDLIVGDGTGGDRVEVTFDDQISDSSDVTVNQGATLELVNVDDAIGTLTLQGATVASGTGTLTLGGNVTNLASATITVISGNLGLGNVTRTIGIASGTAFPDLDITANISGGFTGVFPNLIFAGITKTGLGTLRLSGNNTYGGTTTLDDGSTLALSDTSFGGIGGGVVISSRATLQLVGVDIGNEALTLNRAEVLGSALTSSGASSWSGPVTLNTNVAVTTGGTLAFSNSITGPGGITFNSGFAGAVFRLAGTNSNTYAGATVLNDGRLELAKTANAIAIEGSTLTIGDGDNIDEVRHLAQNQIFTSVGIIFATNGLLNLNNFTDDVGSLTFNGGTITTGTGTITPDDIVVNASDQPATISGRLALNGARTWTINAGTPVCDLTIDASISGSGSLVKNGTGTVCLNSSNSFSGAVTIDAGVVRIDDDFALGTSAGGTVVNSGGVLFVDTFADDVSELLTLNGSGPGGAGALQVVGTVTWHTNVTLASSATINCNPSALCIIDGIVSGSGGLRKTGLGTLRLAGAGSNPYTGPTVVDVGTLQLAKTSGFAIQSGSLSIGDGFGGVNADVVRYLGAGQLLSSVPITIRSSGLLDLNGFNDDIGALTFFAGEVHTGAGIATLAGNVTATQDAGTIAFISGHLQFNNTRTITVNPGPDGIFPELRIAAEIVGAGGLTKAGDGYLSLSGSNSYAGTTIVNDGVLWIEDSFALGSTAAGTTVNSGGGLRISGDVHVPLEQLTLGSTNSPAVFAYGGSNSWAGNIVLAANETINVTTGNFLNLSGAISGSFGIIKQGAGTLIFSGNAANTYSGDTRVNEGTLLLSKSVIDGSIAGDLFIGDGTGGALSDVVRIVDFPQINLNSAVTIASSGLFDLNDITESVASISGSGRIDLGNGVLGINGGASTTYAGLIVGTGGISKSGVGTLTLINNNTYSGQTLIVDGTLRVNGSQPQSRVVVNNSGTLAGDGVVGNLTASGSVAPGASPAILTCSNLTLAATADFFVEINGSNPGTGYDVLNVRGTNQLGNATLHLSLNYPPSEGQRFTIISNDLAEAVAGTFAGLPNGSVISAGGRDFRVHYNVGNNDVELVCTNVPARAPFIIVGNPDHDVFVDINECSIYLFGITNLSALPMTGISARLESRTSGVAVTQPFSVYPDAPGNGRSTNAFPFQISTMANFLCGAEVQLALVLETASHGSFTIPITLQSGHVGAPVRFNNNTAVPIPDLSTVDSLINVSGITTPIRRVTVSMHITHTADNDLDISLISPSGITVNLSSDNGGTASDYGTSCADADRTTFSDLGATSIVGASAPFVGTFRPEIGLFNFNELVGSDVNGTWTLRITDDTGGAVGTLRCWSLFISPAACNDAGGPCESCPERTIFGSIGTNSTVQAARVARDTIPSLCGLSKPCPGLVVAGSRFYDAFTFINGESNACITVTLQSEADLFSVAYLDSYDPTNLCQNYLADMGDSTGNGQTNYAFQVSAGARFIVVVNQVNPGGEGAYRLDVTGGSCRPKLNITHLGGTRVLLDWSTSAIDFDLERRSSLSPGALWLPVFPPMYVRDSRYIATNNVSPDLIRFFRLHKP